MRQSTLLFASKMLIVNALSWQTSHTLFAAAAEWHGVGVSAARPDTFVYPTLGGFGLPNAQKGPLKVQRDMVQREPITLHSPSLQSRAGFIFEAAWVHRSFYNAVLGAENALPDREIRQNTLQISGAYGLGHKITLGIHAPLSWLRSGDPAQPNTAPQRPSGRLSGIGNASIYLKKALPGFRRTDLSVSLRAEFPASRSRQNTALATGFEAFALVPMLHLGIKDFQQHGFVYGGLGLRSHKMGPVLHSGAAYERSGRSFGAALATSLFLSVNADKAPLAAAQSLNGLYHPKQSVWLTELKAKWAFDRFTGADIRVSLPIWGRFYPKGPFFAAALYVKWD